MYHPNFLEVLTDLATLLEDYDHIHIGFVYATWALETGYGSSIAWINNNNPAGIIKLDGSGEYESYPSQIEGLKAMVQLLDNYYQVGLKTIDEVRTLWSESYDSDTIASIWKSILK